MKLIVLPAILLISMAVAQAGDVKAKPAKDAQASPCCAAEKVKTSSETKGTCPFATSACCKAAPVVKQTALLSPKATDAKR
jgi:hypothetical protein